MWAQVRPLVALLAAWSVCAVAVVLSTSWWDGPAAAQTTDLPPLGGAEVDGETLWKRDCASCHGATGDGSAWAPSLQGKGPAAVALTVTTGRMPIEQLAPYGAGGGPIRMKPTGRPSYPPAEVEELVAYARTILTGPDVAPVDVAGADLARGQQLFQQNCAACHSWSGRGGALTAGMMAPTLMRSTPTQVVEAMRTGLGSMPVFSARTFDDQDATAIAAYVQELRQQEHGNEGAASSSGLAFRGPLVEGAVAWLVGILAILLAVRWIGARS